MPYHLTIHKIDHSCLFELAWGKGQRLTASLTFPSQLLALYETWRRVYLGYYQQSLRGRPGAVGQVATLTVDWHSQLVQAEARLLSEFHTWLKHSDLYDLREELRRMAQLPAENRVLFLACTPLELARLPWETWEFGPQVQIVRSPPTIRSATVHRQGFRQGKARVLAILGDDTGLDFADERRALSAQTSLLEVHYVGWQPGENAAVLKQRICEAIADPRAGMCCFLPDTATNRPCWMVKFLSRPTPPWPSKNWPPTCARLSSGGCNLPCSTHAAVWILPRG